eukprot:5326558-Prymnesium_polylepis.1
MLAAGHERLAELDLVGGNHLPRTRPIDDLEDVPRLGARVAQVHAGFGLAAARACRRGSGWASWRRRDRRAREGARCGAWCRGSRGG